VVNCKHLLTAWHLSVNPYEKGATILLQTLTDLASMCTHDWSELGAVMTVCTATALPSPLEVENMGGWVTEGPGMLRFVRRVLRCWAVAWVGCSAAAAGGGQER